MKSNPGPQIRLSTTSYAVLSLLGQFGDATSYDLKRWLERSIENFWPVPHTTAYEEPARLAAAGYLSARQEPGGRRRKVYSLTDRGRKALRDWAAVPTAAPPQLRDELVLKIFAGAEPELLVEERLAWHRAKIAELEGYLAEVGDAAALAGSHNAILTGIAYHRAMIEMMDRLRAVRAPQTA